MTKLINVNQLNRTLAQMEKFAAESEVESRERLDSDNVFDHRHGEWLKGRTAAYRLAIDFIQRDIDLFAVDKEDLEYV